MITIIIYILSYYYILLVYYYCYRSNHWIELPHCWDSQVRHRRPTSGRPPWPAVPNMAFFGVCFFLIKSLRRLYSIRGIKLIFPFSVFFLHQQLEWCSTIKHNGISSLMFGVRQRRISTVDRQIISPLVMFHEKRRHGTCFWKQLQNAGCFSTYGELQKKNCRLI